jgi:hypothetical protein
MRSRNGLVLTTISVILVGGSLAPSPREDTKAKIAELGRQRLAVIREAIKVESKRTDIGEGAIQSTRIWTRRLVEAHRQAGSAKADLVSALKDLLALEVRNEHSIQAMYKSGGATPLMLYDAQDSLLEAKIWLLEAEAK